jgi:hypothetical protein
MNRKHAGLIVALAAFAAAPAFAEGGKISSSSSTSVTSGTGVVVGQGAPGTTVIVEPAATVALVPGTHLLPGAAQVQASQTTVMGAPAPGIVSSQTVVTRYWVNVPAGVEHRDDFQRWTRLK